MTTVRDMRWQDLDQVAAIEAGVFPEDGWSPATLWAELAGRPRRAYLVVEDAGRVRGYAGLDVAGDTADVMTVAVDPATRGAGLGTMLIDHLLQVARERGCAQVLLEVRGDNAPAIELYRRHGFVQLHTRPGYYRGGTDALVMRAEVGHE